jgi:predicted nucleic acid-binding protein
MTKPRVYLETTVVSYAAALPSRDLVAAAHQQITREWMREHRGSYDVFVSQLVVREGLAGDKEAVERRVAILRGIESLALTDEAADLARALVDRGAIPKRSVEDALHIAVAAVHGMDYLLTWNCRNIANATMRTRIDAVCRSGGYEPPVICTPEELIDATER